MLKRNLPKKYALLFYQKAETDWFINGGKLLITDREYVINYFLKTVMRFSKGNTTVTKIPDATYPLLYGKGLCLSNGFQSIRLYFTAKTASKVYQLFELE